MSSSLRLQQKDVRVVVDVAKISRAVLLYTVSSSSPYTTQSVGGLRHVFCSTGQDYFGLPQHDFLSTIDDSLETRSTKPVDGESRRFNWHTRPVTDVPGKVGGVFLNQCT